MQIYIGIDPGTVKLGFAVIGDKQLLASGTVKLDTKKSEIDERIIAMSYQMRSLFQKYRSAEKVRVGIEDQYIGKNARDQIKLSRLTGAIMFICFDVFGDLPIFVQTTKLQTLYKAPTNMTTGEYASTVARMLYKKVCETDDEAVAICIAEYIRRFELEAGAGLQDTD